MKKNYKVRTVLFAVILISFTIAGFIVSGCSSDSNGVVSTPTPSPTSTSTASPSPSPSGSPGQTYTYSSAVTNMESSPMSGMTVTLMNSSLTVLGTATTGADGRYSFSGLSANTPYITRYSGNANYPPFNHVFYITGDTTDDGQDIPSYTEAATFMGGGRTVDSNYGYIVAGVRDSNGEPLSGITLNLTGGSFAERGYFYRSGESMYVNWTTSSTLNAGMVMFYRVTPGSAYVLTPSASGYTFEPALMDNIRAVAGEIVELPEIIGTP